MSPPIPHISYRRRPTQSLQSYNFDALAGSPAEFLNGGVDHRVFHDTMTDPSYIATAPPYEGISALTHPIVHIPEEDPVNSYVPEQYLSAQDSEFVEGSSSLRRDQQFSGDLVERLSNFTSEQLESAARTIHDSQAYVDNYSTTHAFPQSTAPSDATQIPPAIFARSTYAVSMPQLAIPTEPIFSIMSASLEDITPATGFSPASIAEVEGRRAAKRKGPRKASDLDNELRASKKMSNAWSKFSQILSKIMERGLPRGRADQLIVAAELLERTDKENRRLQSELQQKNELLTRLIKSTANSPAAVVPTIPNHAAY